MITPMLAATVREDGDLPPFPLLATPKVDGVRALIVNGGLVSRSLRRLPSTVISSTLESLLPEGADGEVFCNSLGETVSAAMSRDFSGNFVFFWFDWCYNADAPYSERAESLRLHAERAPSAHVRPLVPELLQDIAELRAYEQRALGKGYEGIVVRVPWGRYKFGRSTLIEGLMAKIKRYTDSEGVIISTHALVHGAGGPRGTPSCMLGALGVRTPEGVTFKIGTGFTSEVRLALWSARASLLGREVKYRYCDVGSNGRPRCPVFICVRHEGDV